MIFSNVKHKPPPKKPLRTSPNELSEQEKRQHAGNFLSIRPFDPDDKRSQSLRMASIFTDFIHTHDPSNRPTAQTTDTLLTFLSNPEAADPFAPDGGQPKEPRSRLSNQSSDSFFKEVFNELHTLKQATLEDFRIPAAHAAYRICRASLPGHTQTIPLAQLLTQEPRLWSNNPDAYPFGDIDSESPGRTHPEPHWFARTRQIYSLLINHDDEFQRLGAVLLHDDPALPIATVLWPTPTQLIAYEAAMASRIDILLGRKGAEQIRVEEGPKLKLGRQEITNLIHMAIAFRAATDNLSTPNRKALVSLRLEEIYDTSMAVGNLREANNTLKHYSTLHGLTTSEESDAGAALVKILQQRKQIASTATNPDQARAAIVELPQNPKRKD